MTFSKAKRKLEEYVEKYGADMPFFHRIDYYKPSERGTVGWKEMPDITLGELVESITDLQWKYETMQTTFDIREILKLLEKGMRPSKVYIDVPESHEEYRQYLNATKDQRRAELNAVARTLGPLQEYSLYNTHLKW